ncbi:MAG: alpha-ketoglutarate-dependent dioxygenase AlkB [Candidatus Dormibacteria bacterium]
MGTAALSWQTSLFAAGEPEPDRSFTSLRRHELERDAWVDHAPGWLHGADTLFQDLLAHAPWQASTQVIYDRTVDTPRLVALWPYEPAAVSLPPRLETIRALLAERYGRDFDSIGANLYRDGRDSVAWHGDRIARSIKDPVVATVSLGHPRRFLMRPRGGSTHLALTLEPGDLVVMGGTFQRSWQHTVPKVASAGPRISITLRHSK